MLTLLSTLVSFLSGGLPRILDFFQDKQDKKHELALAQLQMQQQMESAMSQIKLMVAQIQVDGMKQKANIEGLWQSVVAEMKVKGQISGETLKGEREVAAAQQQQIADAISQSSQQAHEKQMQQQQPISV